MDVSNAFTNEISLGELTRKPGWIHPTTKTEETVEVCDNLKELVKNHKEWGLDYQYIPEPMSL